MDKEDQVVKRERKEDKEKEVDKRENEEVGQGGPGFRRESK